MVREGPRRPGLTPAPYQQGRTGNRFWPGTDAFRLGPRPGIPRQVQASFRLWLVAVAAGLFETVLAVVDATDGEVGPAAEVAVGVAVRLLVFTAAIYLAAQLRQGSTGPVSLWRCCWAGSGPCRW